MKEPDKYSALASAAFIRGLFLSGGLVFVLISVSFITEIVFIDFIHGNPHRSQANAVGMILLQTPIIAGTFSVIAVIVLAVSQLLQVMPLIVLLRCFWYRGMMGSVMLIPLAALISWYCLGYVDSIMSRDFSADISDDVDWIPYQYDLTLPRYMALLTIQVVVTDFFLMDIYLRDAGRTNALRKVTMIMAGCCIIGGVFLGHSSAVAQYRFL